MAPDEMICPYCVGTGKIRQRCVYCLGSGMRSMEPLVYCDCPLGVVLARTDIKIPSAVEETMTPQLNGEPLMTASYAAYLLGRSTNVVRGMARRGELDAAGVVFIGGNRIMFDRTRFREWLHAGGDRQLQQQPNAKNDKV